jgi:hypothetical protein
MTTTQIIGLYRVEGGIARIPVLGLVGITEEQFPRYAAVIEDVYEVGDRYIVRALQEILFEPGEVIGLTEEPTGALAAVLVEVSE